MNKGIISANFFECFLMIIYLIDKFGVTCPCHVLYLGLNVIKELNLSSLPYLIVIIYLIDKGALTSVPRHGFSLNIVN